VHSWILHFGDGLPRFDQILLCFRQLPAESNDKLALFSIGFNDARNVRGECCSGHALTEVSIPPRHDQTCIFAMANESAFLRSDERTPLAKGSPHSDHTGWPKRNETVPRFVLVHEKPDLQIYHLRKHSPSCSMIQRNRSCHDSNTI
jgi:hypothetical protein